MISTAFARKGGGAVEPDCAHRYGSVIELAEEIDRLLAGAARSWRGPAVSATRAERFITRHYRGLTLTAIAFVTLAHAGRGRDLASQPVPVSSATRPLAVIGPLGEFVELSDPDRIGTPMIGAQTMLQGGQPSSGPADRSRRGWKPESSCSINWPARCWPTK